MCTKTLINLIEFNRIDILTSIFFTLQSRRWLHIKPVKTKQHIDILTSTFLHLHLYIYIFTSAYLHLHIYIYILKSTSLHQFLHLNIYHNIWILLSAMYIRYMKMALHHNWIMKLWNLMWSIFDHNKRGSLLKFRRCDRYPKE
jgi:hypothetical protein